MRRVSHRVGFGEHLGERNLAPFDGEEPVAERAFHRERRRALAKPPRRGRAQSDEVVRVLWSELARELEVR